MAEYKSEPLAETVRVTLKVSHNLYASTLPVLVGAGTGADTPRPGCGDRRSCLQGLGVEPAAVSFAGGAGGANADSVTPRATVGLLKAMAKHTAGKRILRRPADPRRGRDAGGIGGEGQPGPR